jgi:hypothetical protein
MIKIMSGAYRSHNGSLIGQARLSKNSTHYSPLVIMFCTMKSKESGFFSFSNSNKFERIKCSSNVEHSLL